MRIGGVGKVFVVFDRRPISGETNVCDGDFIGIVGIGKGSCCWLLLDRYESDSVKDIGQTLPCFGGNRIIDQSIHDFSDELYGLHGSVHNGVNVEWVWSVGRGGKKPIHVDPEQIPDHGIDGKRKTLP